MEPAGVVPALDVVEDGPVEPGQGRPGAVIDELAVDSGEEALGDGVVSAFALAGDGQDDAMCPGQDGVVLAGVLGSRDRRPHRGWPDNNLSLRTHRGDSVMSNSSSRRFPVTVTHLPPHAASSATAPSPAGPGTSARS